MKVVQINACYGYKSTGTIMKDIGECASKENIKMYYVYQTCIEKPEKGYQIGNKLDWKWHALVSRVCGRQAYGSIQATKKMLKWMDSIKPDIVQLHNLHSNYINLNLLCKYLSRNNIATVITLHDCWYFTGKCSHYVSVSCDKWKTTCGECPQLDCEIPSWFGDHTKNVLKDRIFNLNSIQKLYLVGCSEWISGEARQSLLKPKEILTIKNGIDVDIFRPRTSLLREKYHIDNKTVVMGMADKWCLEENVEAVEYLCNNAGKDTIFVVVGCSDEQKKMLAKYKNVLAIGYVKEREQLADIYSMSDVFVNLTHADTLPTVNMESICCGTPVITYDCCGSPELVLEGCGCIVPEGDYLAVLKSIYQVKGTNNRQDVSQIGQTFDKWKRYKKYIDLYKKMGS